MMWGPPPQEAQDAGIMNWYDCHWRTLNVKNTAEIPLFGDSWAEGGCPMSCDSVPEYDGEAIGSAIGVGEMSRVCVNRHNGAINNVFFDLSVRKIGLKSLWKQRWHRGYDFNGGPIDGEPFPIGWPDWMKNFGY